MFVKRLAKFDGLKLIVNFILLIHVGLYEKDFFYT